MARAAAEKVGALALLLALAVPSVSQATLADFGAAGGGLNLSDVNEIPAMDPTALDLLFSTSGTDDPLAACEAGPGCISGWTGTLTTTGTLQIIDYDASGNSNTASGPGETSCDASLLPASICQTNGGDDGNGEAGDGIVMFSVTLSGGSPGDQLLYTGGFTLSDFSSVHEVTNQTLAVVVPEPNTLLLLAFGLAGLAHAGKRSA